MNQYFLAILVIIFNVACAADQTPLSALGKLQRDKIIAEIPAIVRAVDAMRVEDEKNNQNYLWTHFSTWSPRAEVTEGRFEVTLSKYFSGRNDIIIIEFKNSGWKYEWFKKEEGLLQEEIGTINTEGNLIKTNKGN